MTNCVARLARLGFCMLAVASLSATAYGQRPGGKVMFRLEDGGGGGASPRQVTFEIYKVHKSCCDECKPKPCWKCCPIASAMTVTAGSEGEFHDLPPGEYLIINKVNGTFAGFEKQVEVKEKSVTRLGTLSVDYGVPSFAVQKMTDRMRPVP